MHKVLFTKEQVTLEQLVNDIHSPADGAVVTFTGQARNHSHGKDVLALDYEIYSEMAHSELEKIIDEAANSLDINNCSVVHRYGYVPVGETSIIIAVSSSHRGAAFDACRYIIDEIKKRVPVWKKEIYRDGTQWITKGS